MNGLAVVVLAAGQGTRMRSSLPKVLHRIAGRPMIQYVLDAVAGLAETKPILVVGHSAEVVRAAVGDAATCVVQTPQLGTGDAVLKARSELEGHASTVAVLYGDMPLLSPRTLQSLVRAHEAQQAAATLLTCIYPDPMGFGRIVRNAEGRVLGIVEEAQATPEQLAIQELNCGIYCFRADWLWEHLPRLPLSPKGEYYLTDLISMAVGEGQTVEGVLVHDALETLGVNDRVHLARVEGVVRQRIREQWLRAGVTMADPATCYIEAGVTIGMDTVIQPNTHLEGNTRIGSQCVLGPNTILRNSTLGDGCRVEASVVEGAVLESHVTVGPFGHLRQGAHLAKGVHMGNFGEVKNSYLGPGAKMGHFSYLGDTTVGANVNIGCGTVTCNFDGVHKHKTVIEDDAFIGSGTMLVAPVKVGARSVVGAGAVVTHDVPADHLAYGVPARARPKPAGHCTAHDEASEPEIGLNGERDCADGVEE